MVELFDAGFGMHHAGMLRPDRTLTEKLFAEGLIKVSLGITLAKQINRIIWIRFVGWVSLVGLFAEGLISVGLKICEDSQRTAVLQRWGLGLAHHTCPRCKRCQSCLGCQATALVPD